MRANWFFGFPIDGRFLLQLPEPPAGFRRYHPDDVHLTLAFLGACGDEAAARAFARLEELLARDPLPAVSISLGAVVGMGSRRAYSALSALLVRGRAEMEAEIGALRAPLIASAGGPPDTRPPKAHVTLARPRRSAGAGERRAGLEWATGLELGSIETVVDRVALYTWHEPRGERLFRRVAERRLGEHPGAHPDAPTPG